MRWLTLVLCGCGFRADLQDMAALDAATSAADLLGFDGASAGGAGPLGSLPGGFCCQSDHDCRSRRCGGGGGTNAVCLDSCGRDADCQYFGVPFSCNVQISLCTPPAGGFVCLDPATFHAGPRESGLCCDDPSGAQCQGGLCLRTGASSNPRYCTQGCVIGEPCPAGYTCAIPANGETDFRQCWLSPTIADPSNQYQCLPIP